MLDLKFCLRWGIKFTPTSHEAKAAGSASISIKGQTKDDIKLRVKDCKSPILWNLGKCIVVDNFGVDILIGEPGKLDKKNEKLKKDRWKLVISMAKWFMFDILLNSVVAQSYAEQSGKRFCSLVIVWLLMFLRI